MYLISEIIMPDTTFLICYNVFMSNKSATKTPLFVKRTDASNGSLWNDYTNKRIMRQHGGYDIPEGDLHSIQKYQDPVFTPRSTQEETNAALSDIEKEIQQLKEKNGESLTSSKPPQDFQEFFEDPQNGVQNKQDDNSR